MCNLNQDDSTTLKQVKKTVDWLVNNTSVNVFDPIEFEGYQRKIDDKHCEKIVKYLENNFCLPTSIVCALDSEFDDSKPLRIVDGQHRIAAFKKLSLINKTRYDQIKDYELSVVVMESVSLETEIDAFITINKTSKKVDTSLAYVLRNKLNVNYNENQTNLSKREYVSVEVAKLINEDTGLWHGKISFDGSPQKNLQAISLNAFVKSTRSLLSTFEKKQLINLNWQKETDVDKCVVICEKAIKHIWNHVSYKWPDLFDDKKFKNAIIQNAIGYNALNRVIIKKIKEIDRVGNLEELLQYIECWIRSINVPSNNWEVGGEYSMYTSESGYSIVAMDLMDSME